ncbi:maltose ABC transporter substrate-binding protein [uncultured Clostridium sp.]|uniref:sugar ABC transporter substrate-binding protein n=1 Tax=uncultured Clostridium sp. TaxID=59620 RepID=UPI00261CC52B|nr:maltose ABC transporter substrate-binding protein [uncultured Clostridium sp.]
MKKKAIIAIIVAAVVIVGGIVIATSGSSEKTITVQSYLTQPEVNALQPIANEWAKENHVKVKLEFQSGSDFQNVMTAMKTSNGPDIVYGIPNDNIGTFVKGGLLAKTPENLIPTNQFTSAGLIKAGEVNGTQYGEPIAEGTTALFYNKKEVPTPPATMEQLIQEAKTKGFQYNLTNFYYSYGFLGANGGYIFKENPNGTFDTNDIGLNNAGAVKGYEFLDSLVKDKLMTISDTDTVSMSNFEAGKTAFYIGGPWNIADLKKSGVDFGVAPLPTLDGKAIPGLSTVQLAIVSEKSKDQTLDWSLIKYLDEHGQDVTTSVGSRIPVLSAENNSATVKNNPYIKGFEDQAKNATYMPSVPETAAVWTPAGNNLTLMVEGKETPQQAADKTVEQIKQGIAQQNQ